MPTYEEFKPLDHRSSEDTIIKLLQVIEKLVAHEFRKKGDEFRRLQNESDQGRSLESSWEPKDGFDNVDVMIEEATTAFFAGLNEQDQELQRLIDEANNTPTAKYNEPLIRRLDKKLRHPWKDFLIGSLALCLPFALMLLGIYFVYELGVKQVYRQIHLVYSVAAAICLTIIMLFFAVRPYLAGVEIWRKVIRPNWRGAFAAACLIAALVGCVGVFYIQDRSQKRIDYSQELAAQQLIDEAIRRLQWQHFNRSFLLDLNHSRSSGRVRVIRTKIPQNQSDEGGEDEADDLVIQITEQHATTDEALLSASVVGLPNTIEMELKPGSGMLNLSFRSRMVVVGEPKLQSDGSVLLGNSNPPVQLAEGVLDVPVEKMHGKLVAVVYKPSDPNNQNGLIKKTERVQILAYNNK